MSGQVGMLRLRARAAGRDSRSFSMTTSGRMEPDGARGVPAEGGPAYSDSLLGGAGGHLLHHGQHQLAVAFVQVGRVTADLGEETDFVFRELRHRTAVAIFPGAFGKEL